MPAAWSECATCGGVEVDLQLGYYVPSVDPVPRSEARPRLGVSVDAAEKHLSANRETHEAVVSSRPM